MHVVYLGGLVRLALEVGTVVGRVPVVPTAGGYNNTNSSQTQCPMTRYERHRAEREHHRNRVSKDTQRGPHARLKTPKCCHRNSERGRAIRPKTSLLPNWTVNVKNLKSFPHFLLNPFKNISTQPPKYDRSIS